MSHHPLRYLENYGLGSRPKLFYFPSLLFSNHSGIPPSDVNLQLWPVLLRSQNHDAPATAGARTAGGLRQGVIVPRSLRASQPLATIRFLSGPILSLRALFLI